MNQTENSTRKEINRVFLSEKFLYICILMTITTLTGIIFSISNSSYSYSYFFNPIISEIVSAAVSNVVTIFVVISYIPMIIAMGILWLVRESARTKPDSFKRPLYGIMAYRIYFYLNIFSCISGIILVNVLSVLVPIVMIVLEVDSTVIIITAVVLRILLFIASIVYVFFGIYLYNWANFLCEIALSIRINKNMITKNKFLTYGNFIVAGFLLVSAPFSGFTYFIYNIAFAAVLLLATVCIYDHNYKYEAPTNQEVNEFYKNLSYNPEYKEVADALGVVQKDVDPSTLTIPKLKAEKVRAMLNMLLGTSLYDGEMFQSEEENIEY